MRFGLFYAVAMSFLQAAPFFLTKNNPNKIRPDALGLLFEHGDVKVWRSLKSRPEEFTDLYAANLHHLFIPKAELETYGDVEAYYPGELALIRLRQPEKVEAISGWLHRQGLACGTIVRLDGSLLQDPVAEPQPWVEVSQNLEAVSRWNDQVEASRIESSIRTLSTIHTRYARGTNASDVTAKIRALYEPFVGKRSDISIYFFQHQSVRQPSLIVKIKGQTKPDETIILGSHIDSIVGNGSATQRSPGADDNASGTATNLEVFRILMLNQVKLHRSLEIHGYAAEELGLIGSDEIAKRYKRENRKTIAMLQNDMNIFSSEGEDKIWFVTTSTSSAFTDMLVSLARRYQTIAVAKAPLFAGTSDHASWTRQGVHAAFPFENPSDFNPHIHTAEDTLDNADRFEQAAAFAKLNLSYIAHFAGIAESL
jgi:Zn-dependent M28 family amino/carboxypeptidase